MTSPKRYFVIFCFFLISSSLIECQDYDDEITPTSGAEANEVQQNPKEVFLELIRQRFNGNVVQQCPCVTPPGTDKCVVYDPRYSAISAEEAAVAFSDLTADNFDTNPFLLAPPLATPDYVRRLIEEGSRYVNDYSRFPSTEYSTKVTEVSFYFL
uniref:Uncharacterized protein n=1 Tax=Panagrolaimus superbus TaxID=310955 RepID=A0A914XZD1_9BILA